MSGPGDAPGGGLPPLDDRPGPARPLSPARVQALARAAVGRALAGEAPAPPLHRPRWRRGPLLAAAAALAVASLASAAAGLVYAARRAALPVPRAGAPAPGGGAGPGAPAPELPGPAAAAEPRAEEVPEEAPAPQPGPAAEVLPPAPEAPPAPPPPAAERPPRRPEPPPRRAHGGLTGPGAGGAGWLPPLDVDRAPLEDLLARANEARRQRDWRTADGLYQAVLRRFPRTDAEVVARVASATLHLERFGDAAGALRDYRQALAARPAGTLAEEARWGIGAALRGLGDASGEVQALGDFLAHHPDSALAPAARQRLGELGR